MPKQHHKAAVIQIPIIIGIAAAVSAAAIFLGKLLAQNPTPPPTNLDNNPPINQPLDQSEQPGQQNPNQPGQGGQQGPNQFNQLNQPNQLNPLNQPGQQNSRQPGQPFNQNQGNQNMMQSQQGDQMDQSGQQPLSPQEIQGTVREVSQVNATVKSLLKKANKSSNLTDEANQLTEMSQQLDKISSDLKSTTDQDELQSIISDYRDVNYQEAMQALRTKIEMPTQIIRLQKDLKKLTNNLKSKSIINAMAKINFDPTPLQQNVDSINTAITTIQNDYNSGDLDSAMSDFQDLMDNQAPADINCVLTAFQEFSRNVSRIKDQEALSAVQDLFAPIKDAATSSQYHDACMSINSIRPTLGQLFSAISRNKTMLNSTVQQKLNNLQNLINQKFPGANATTTQETTQQPPDQLPPQTNQ